MAEEDAGVLATRRVAELFHGLDFARVDDQAGEASSLVQEIWRLFLMAMLLALVGEASSVPARKAGSDPSRQPRMNRPSTSSLTFVWSPWSLAAVGVVVIAGTAGLCLSAWRRSGYRRRLRPAGAAALRLVVFGRVCLFNQPEWVEEYRPEEKPSIAVLWDNSASMDTRDVVREHDRRRPSRLSRREAIAPLDRARRSGDRWKSG